MTRPSKSLDLRLSLARRHKAFLDRPFGTSLLITIFIWLENLGRDIHQMQHSARIAMSGLRTKPTCPDISNGTRASSGLTVCTVTKASWTNSTLKVTQTRIWTFVHTGANSVIKHSPTNSRWQTTDHCVVRCHTNIHEYVYRHLSDHGTYNKCEFCDKWGIVPWTCRRRTPYMASLIFFCWNAKIEIEKERTYLRLGLLSKIKLCFLGNNSYDDEENLDPNYINVLAI